MPRINKNISNCLNCKSPFAEADQFCSNCSQKRTDGLISAKDLFTDFFSTVFNIDGKLFNSIKDLFIPGKLTTAFFSGQHEKYYKPLRMFFVFMVAHIAVLSLTIFNANNITTGGFENALSDLQFKKELKIELDTILIEQRQQFTSKNEQIVLDSISSTLDTRIFNNLDSVVITDAIQGMEDAIILNVDIGDFKIAVDDLALLDTDFGKFAEKYEIKEFWAKLVIQQAYRVSTDPKGTVAYVLGNMTWMLIFLIPAIALILKLLFIRKKYYYVQHLVFLFHNHAFAFLTMTIVALTVHFASYVQKGFGLISASLLGLIVYFFLAMKRYYGQSFIKTFFKFGIVTVCYLFISVIFFLITILFSFALYS